MQWVTIMTYCLEDEVAVANRGPVSQRRRRRGASPNAKATSATQIRTCTAACPASEGRSVSIAHPSSCASTLPARPKRRRRREPAVQPRRRRLLS